MKKAKSSKIEVQGTAIAILSGKDGDYISLTDMLRAKDGDFFIADWLRNRNTVEFLGIWEFVFNPAFNYGEFATIRSQAGLNSYKISVKEFRCLKDDESCRLSLAWNLNRTLSKLNYRLHTDAIKAHLIPAEVTAAQAAVTYASEADVLNVALAGCTVKQWRDANPGLDGNMRDHATIERLLVPANIEGMNAEFIHMSLTQRERLKRLNQIAIRQMQALTSGAAARLLDSGPKAAKK